MDTWVRETEIKVAVGEWIPIPGQMKIWAEDKDSHVGVERLRKWM